jgi:hypothetical protein
MADTPTTSNNERYREMAKRSHGGRVVLPREDATVLRGQLCRWLEADPSRSAAWARLWAKLLAPRQDEASPTTEEGGA